MAMTAPATVPGRTRACCVLAGILALSGCGGHTATSPSTPAPVGFAGEWTGTTFQNRPIAFTVSPGQVVTALSVGYQIDACSGVDVFSDASSARFLSGVPGFVFAAVLPDKRQISIQAYLMPDASVSGALLVYGPPSCGPSEEVAGPFTAYRHP